MTEPAPMRILVIDDNPDDRLLEMRELFALFPQAEVVELTNLEEFDEAIEVAEPSLVLTDLDLRWANGRQVLERVKARYPLCPVVMFTGTGSETIAVDLMKAGLDDYVVKSPRQMPRLRTSIKIAVEMASSRAALSDRERQLSRALATQQMIVHELHHRVKNNLQTVSSLLRLGSRDADEVSKRHLAEVAGRMDALGAVQARIYQTQQLDQVDYGAALGDIAESLISVHAPGRVSLTVRLEDLSELDVTRAMPLSLLAYELILNAMKHAWPDGRQGMLSIRTINDGSLCLQIVDDGVGFDVADETAGTGRRLIKTLAAEAAVEVTTVSRPGKGSTATVRFL